MCSEGGKGVEERELGGGGSNGGMEVEEEGQEGGRLGGRGGNSLVQSVQLQY